MEQGLECIKERWNWDWSILRKRWNWDWNISRNSGTGIGIHQETVELGVSLLSDFPKDLIYVPCGISQDWIVRLPSLNARHNKKDDSKVPNVYFSEPSI